ncbi:hypothetical protein EOK76_g0873 [Lacticaseibacillus paracasei]|nr:hypothetical protein EOK76_g0873 [Lacticaseibacillus paracasei]
MHDHHQAYQPEEMNKTASKTGRRFFVLYVIPSWCLKTYSGHQ